MTGYCRSLREFVTGKLSSFYDGLRPFYAARGKSDDSLSYFDNHLPRFQAMIEVCTENGITVAGPKKIAELGSWYPYVSWWWKHQDPEVRIDLFDIITREISGLEPYDVEGVRLIEHNLCTESLPEDAYDLVFLSEVMEHLPCNLFALEERVIRCLKPSGFLLVTYPMLGHGASGYDQDVPGYDLERLVEPHLREFTPETVPLFFKGLKTVAHRSMKYPAYGPITIMLYQQED